MLLATKNDCQIMIYVVAYLPDIAGSIDNAEAIRLETRQFQIAGTHFLMEGQGFFLKAAFAIGALSAMDLFPGPSQTLPGFEVEYKREIRLEIIKKKRMQPLDDTNVQFPGKALIDKRSVKITITNHDLTGSHRRLDYRIYMLGTIGHV